MLDSALLSTMDVVVKIQVYVEACPRLSCVLSGHGTSRGLLRCLREKIKTLLSSKTFGFTLSRPREEEGFPSRGGFVFGELDLIPDGSTFDSDNLLQMDPDTD